MPGLVTQPLTPDAAAHLGNCGHFYIGDTSAHALVDRSATPPKDDTACVIQCITDTEFTALVETMEAPGYSAVTGVTFPAGTILRSGTGWTSIQLASGFIRCARKG